MDVTFLSCNGLITLLLFIDLVSYVTASYKFCQHFPTDSIFHCKEVILGIKLHDLLLPGGAKQTLPLPAQRLHEVSVQEVMIPLHRRYVNGELGI